MVDESDGYPVRRTRAGRRRHRTGRWWKGSSTGIGRGAGVPWRDLPHDFGTWQTVWKRHHRWFGRRRLGPRVGRDPRGGRRERWSTWKVTNDKNPSSYEPGDGAVGRPWAGL